MSFITDFQFINIFSSQDTSRDDILQENNILRSHLVELNNQILLLQSQDDYTEREERMKSLIIQANDRKYRAEKWAAIKEEESKQLTSLVEEQVSYTLYTFYCLYTV
jgi:hypothetical protein